MNKQAWRGHVRGINGVNGINHSAGTAPALALRSAWHRRGRGPTSRLGRGAPVRHPGDTRRGARNPSCSLNNCKDVCPWSRMGVLKAGCGGMGLPAMPQRLLRRVARDKGTWHLLPRPSRHAELLFWGCQAGETLYSQRALQPWPHSPSTLGSDFVQKQPIFFLITFKKGQFFSGQA